jgi:hypothetical protein
MARFFVAELPERFFDDMTLVGNHDTHPLDGSGVECVCYALDFRAATILVHACAGAIA